MDISTREQGTYRFGAFQLDPPRRTLLCRGARVKLAERLFDTLLYLVVTTPSFTRNGVAWRTHLPGWKKAYALKDSGLTEIETNPFLDPIRNTDRFRAVERQLGLRQ